MAILASSLRNSGRIRWAVVACAIGFLASCSDTAQAPPAESSPESVPLDESTSSVPLDESTSQDHPPTQIFLIRSEIRWSVGVDEPPAAPDDRLRYLVPTTPINGTNTDARLLRADAGPASELVPELDLVLKWPTGRIRMSGKPAKPTVRCSELWDGNGRLWKPVRIRNVQGCENTTDYGQYSVRWVEDETEFRYSSYDITDGKARDMLEDWDWLE